MAFFLETLLGGLMAGMLYSLVALGFVLIFKASGVFNFAQGAMVLFAALAMARFAEWCRNGPAPATPWSRPRWRS
jgi:branched-chain amino acid transport system permease protein